MKRIKSPVATRVNSVPVKLELNTCPAGFVPERTVFRVAIRALAESDGRLLMIRSAAVGGYKFPGGGAEEGESPLETLAREIAEESGYELRAIACMAFSVRETRAGTLNPLEALSMRSDYFICSVGGKPGEQKLDDYERERGFEPVFITAKEALQANLAIARDASKETPPWLEREIRILRLIVRNGIPSPIDLRNDLRLVSPRLVAEPVSPAHREAIFASFTGEITRYMHPAPAKEIPETDAFIAAASAEREAGTDLQFALISRSDGTFVGCLGIHGIDTPLPELGIWIRKEAFGSGYGRETVHAAIEWGFANFAAEGFRYPVDRRNAPSRKIAETAGGLPMKEYVSRGMAGNDLDQIEYLIPREPLAMPCAPSLAPYARWIEVPGGERLFLYDSAATAARATIILVHGLGDEADSWRSLFPLLAARGYRVIAPDLPGFGRSLTNKKVRMRMHAAAIAEVIRFACPGGEKTFLAGSSLGGAVCQLAAFANPEQVAGIAFLDGGLPTNERFNPWMLAAFVPGLPERGYRAYRGNPERAYRSLAPYYSSLEALGENDRSFLRERVTARVESERQMRAYYASFRDYLLLALTGSGRFTRGLAYLCARSIRFLVLWGSADRILSIEGNRALLNALHPAECASQNDSHSRPSAGPSRPSPEYRVLDGVGHLPHQEQPEAIADAFARFMDP